MIIIAICLNIKRQARPSERRPLSITTSARIYEGPLTQASEPLTGPDSKTLVGRAAPQAVAHEPRRHFKSGNVEAIAIGGSRVRFTWLSKLAEAGEFVRGCQFGLE
jgi:hypothetical protein